MKPGLLIFSRLDSRRLPGKALAPVADRPLLGRVIDRVRRAAAAGPCVLCTSDRDIDDPIAELARGEGLEVHRGEVEDVLARAVGAAERFGFEHVVRISGDSPFMDPALIDRLIAVHAAEAPDITTNTFPRTFPPGMSVEVLRAEVLRRVARATDDGEDREHVTRYIYAHAGEFEILNVAAEKDYTGLKLTVDTADDLARADWIARRVPGDAGLDEIAAAARAYEAGAPAGRRAAR